MSDDVLERAITYTLGTLREVTPDELAAPTPCHAWDLRLLLEHLTDSLHALIEAVDVGRVDLVTPDRPPAADPVATVRSLACHLLGVWAGSDLTQPVLVGDHRLTGGFVTGTGAIEIAVHGWDIARACGVDRPIPAALADELLDLSPLLVRSTDRLGRFAPPVAVPPSADAGDRLVAFLGRRPRRTATT